jgi:hypothetical protein
LFLESIKMKIKLDKQQLGGLPPAQWLRRAGYALIYDRHSDQESFSRRFSRDFYPRFHLYVQEINDSTQLFFNLHLDHKKASYAGQTRHSADYEGELVAGEAQRLRALLLDLNSQVGDNRGLREGVSKLGVKEGDDVLNTFEVARISEVPSFKKKSFWQKIFS